MPPIRKKNARKRAARRPEHLKFADTFEAEADEHELNGRHSEARVLRTVVKRLRGEKDEEIDGGDTAAY